MTSFATAASNRDSSFCVIITIEGVGEYGSDGTAATGLWKFCSVVPTYAAADSTYKDWLTEWPDVLSERVEILGGGPDAGELAFSILDGHDGDPDALTSKLRTQARSVGYLASNMTAATTSAATNSDTPYTAASSMIFIGSEAMKVTAKPGSNVLTVTRACLGTEAQIHKQNDRIGLYIPNERSRRVRLYLAPKDGGSSADEVQFGPDYYVDYLALKEGSDGATLGEYSLRTKGQRKYLDRTFPKAPVSMTVRRLPGPNGAAFDLRIHDPYRGRRDWLEQQWPGEDIFTRFGEDDEKGEVIALTPGWRDVTVIAGLPTRRGIAGTRLGAEIKPGDTAWPVYVANRELPGSIRYSPGPSPSTSMSSGRWVPSDHWIDIILWLATGSAHPDDGLCLTNYLTAGTDEEKTNWSSAPIGIGCGIPIAKINVTQLLALRARTPQDRFPGYYVGAPWKEKETFLQHITRWFLKPLGAFASMSNGQFTLILPRVPLEGEATTAVGNDEILREPVDEEHGLYKALIGARQEMGLLASTVSFRTRGPGGTEVVNVTNSDFAGLYGQLGYYADEEKPIEIDAPGIDPALLRDFAMRRLYRFHRPLWAISFTTDFSLYALVPGSLVAITNVELPNESTGARGWTSVAAQIVERTIRIGPDGGGIEIDWKAIGFGPGKKFGRIAPSAYITGVSSNTVTINENRYCQTDGGAAGLPDADVDAFTATERLSLKNLDGSSAAAGYESISSKSGNTMTLSGNFSGSLAVGKVLVFASIDDAIESQYSVYVYLADVAEGLIGSSNKTAWSYAEA